MSSPVRRDYWRQVRTRAWERSKENFQWVYPLVTGIVVFGITAAAMGRAKALEDLTATLIAASATAAVALVAFGLNAIRAIGTIYEEQLSAVTRIERMKEDVITRMTDEFSLTIQTVKTQFAAVEQQLVLQRKNQALADRLTELRRWAIVNLLNKTPPVHRENPLVGTVKESDIEEWRIRERIWQDKVLDAMREYGCTPQDIHKVEMIKTFPMMVELHPSFDAAKDLSMLNVRLDRIQEIIDKYAQ